MKAIIPVAGAGVNLRPHTYTQPKPLIAVAGKPIIAFIIDQLKMAGIDDFVFVLGYLGDKIKDYLNENYSDLNKSYVYQKERYGLGHAIYLTREIINDHEEIVILLGDTIIDMDMSEFVRLPGSILATQVVKDPRQFGVVERDKNGKVLKVVEKPSIPKSNHALAGLYKIAEVQELYKALDMVSAEARINGTEAHLADGFMKMIDSNIEFQTYEVSHWYDCGKKEVLLETNQVLLERHSIDVGTQYIYENTIILPPVVIGLNSKFSNCIIGPHVTLGKHVNIQGSIISDSILGDYVHLKDTNLQNSIIGNDAVIKGLPQSLNIGDNNVIDFSK